MCIGVICCRTLNLTGVETSQNRTNFLCTYIFWSNAYLTGKRVVSWLRSHSRSLVSYSRILPVHRSSTSANTWVCSRNYATRFSTSIESALFVSLILIKPISVVWFRRAGVCVRLASQE